MWIKMYLKIALIKINCWRIVIDKIINKVMMFIYIDIKIINGIRISQIVKIKTISTTSIILKVISSYNLVIKHNVDNCSNSYRNNLPRRKHKSKN